MKLPIAATAVTISSAPSVSPQRSRYSAAISCMNARCRGCTRADTRWGAIARTRESIVSRSPFAYASSAGIALSHAPPDFICARRSCVSRASARSSHHA
ncbi:MAG: hypothetical protein U0414_22235 [Polyangiaceae bacterium]